MNVAKQGDPLVEHTAPLGVGAEFSRARELLGNLKARREVLSNAVAHLKSPIQSSKEANPLADKESARARELINNLKSRREVFTDILASSKEASAIRQKPRNEKDSASENEDARRQDEKLEEFQGKVQAFVESLKTMDRSPRQPTRSLSASKTLSGASVPSNTSIEEPSDERIRIQNRVPRSLEPSVSSRSDTSPKGATSDSKGGRSRASSRKHVPRVTEANAELLPPSRSAPESVVERDSATLSVGSRDSRQESKGRQSSSASRKDHRKPALPSKRAGRLQTPVSSITTAEDEPAEKFELRIDVLPSSTSSLTESIEQWSKPQSPVSSVNVRRRKEQRLSRTERDDSYPTSSTRNSRPPTLPDAISRSRAARSRAPARKSTFAIQGPREVLATKTVKSASDGLSLSKSDSAECVSDRIEESRLSVSKSIDPLSDTKNRTGIKVDSVVRSRVRPSYKSIPKQQGNAAGVAKGAQPDDSRAKELMRTLRGKTEALDLIVKKLKTRDPSVLQDSSSTAGQTESLSSTETGSHAEWTKETDLTTVGDLSSDDEMSTESSVVNRRPSTSTSVWTESSLEIPSYLKTGARKRREVALHTSSEDAVYERPLPEARVRIRTHRSEFLRDMYGTCTKKQSRHYWEQSGSTSRFGRAEVNREMLKQMKKQHPKRKSPRPSLGEDSKFTRDNAHGIALAYSHGLRREFLSILQNDVARLKKKSEKVKRRRSDAVSESSSSAAFTADSNTSGWLSLDDQLSGASSGIDVQETGHGYKDVVSMLEPWTSSDEDEDEGWFDFSDLFPPSAGPHHQLFVPECVSDKRCGAAGGPYYLFHKSAEDRRQAI